MFRDAYARASKFTFPIIISQRTSSGACSAGIAAYVIVNDEGWIVTAGHVLQQLVSVVEQAAKNSGRGAAELAIRADKSIDDRTRRTRLKDLGHPKPSDVTDASPFWGGSPSTASISNISIIEAVDMGLAKLEGFVPPAGQTYPVFKNPSIGFDAGGVSLCKLGFPFHSITPAYNSSLRRFELPSGALPVPLFPIEGILTRIAQVVVTGASDPSIPLKWVETSSPGLRGQSGGPTFDTNGTIWAIQCRTSHFELGFNSPKQQYYNVGLGVHTETLFNVFDRNAVKYRVSDY